MTGAGKQTSHPARQWLKALHTPPEATRRLICFPHAGGAATGFHAWIEHLPPRHELWAVQYPGREDRADEPVCAELRELARQAAFAIQWMTDLPYLMFGHSMGSIVAYETCRQLALLGISTPERLWVSGSPRPDLAGPRSGYQPGSSVRPHLLTSGQAAEPGIPAELGEQRQRLAAETLNADLGALSGYRVREPYQVPCPLTVAYNADDTALDPDDAQGWQDFAAAGLDVVELPGDHFACLTRPGETLAEMFPTGR